MIKESIIIDSIWAKIEPSLNRLIDRVNTSIQAVNTALARLSMFKLPLVLGTALAILLPVAAQAQSFEPFPFEECSGLIVNYICHARVDGDPALYSIPTGFDGRLGLGAVRLGTNSNMFFVIDLQTEQMVAYIYTDDHAVMIPTPSGMPSYNNPRLLGQVTEEMAELLIQLVSYQ